VYLKVSPMKGVKRFGVKGKLAPRDIGPFPIIEKCGTMAYKLELPPSLTGVHDIFHVSQLKKCLKAPVDVILPEVTPLESDLTYPEHSIKILDHQDCVTRRTHCHQGAVPVSFTPCHCPKWVHHPSSLL
jgi:hypothetical protein